MSDSNKDYKAVSLAENPFIKSSCKIYMPSIFTNDEEAAFTIARDWQQPGYATIRESINHIYTYQYASDYRYVYKLLDDKDMYWLKFIARFKSVQSLQLQRQVAIYPNMLSRNKENEALKKLFKYGLTWKWSFERDYLEKPVTVYTLSDDGYRFLEYIFGNNNSYFQPQNFFRLDIKYHIRFWEIVDVYQLFLSMPFYKGFDTYFSLGSLDAENRKKRNLYSPLQECLELFPNQKKNCVFFPALQTDNDDYYKKAITLWSKFTEDGSNLEKPVGKLEGSQNVLAFYAPTVSVADRLNSNLSLSLFNFPILILVGSVIQKEGLLKAFYVPDKNGELPKLKRIELPGLINEGDENSF